MLKVSVDLSRDNDAKKLAIWRSAFSLKQLRVIRLEGSADRQRQQIIICLLIFSF